MKRIFSTILIIFLLACMVCVTACSPDKSVVDRAPVVNTESDHPAVEGLDGFEGQFGNEWLSGNEVEDKYHSASILGEGSPAMVVALLALAASVVSISLNIALYKKVSAITSAKGNEETEDEE